MLKLTIVGLILFMCAGCSTPTQYISQEEYQAQLAAQKNKRRHDEEENKRFQELKQDYVSHIPGLSAERAAGILYGKLVRGMTENEVSLVWLPPTSVNTSEGVWGKHEQWVYDRGMTVFGGNPYGDANPGRYYLYFENGVLSSWQHFD
jgi:hypothetical protein